MPLKKKTIRLTRRIEEIIYDIKEDRGFMNDTQVIYFALLETHMKFFPPYSYQNKVKEREKQREHQDKVRLSRAEKKMKEQENMCLMDLGGTVKITDDGTRICEYYTYSYKRRYLQEIPVDMIDDMVVKNQYEPSKKEVEKLQKQKKVNYKGG